MHQSRCCIWIVPNLYSIVQAETSRYMPDMSTQFLLYFRNSLFHLSAVLQGASPGMLRRAGHLCDLPHLGVYSPSGLSHL